ncbi:hypothetical protein [Cupriavidus gilardii]|nr:hypothetical protein [Cupriavidus gilardii]UXC37179.1 hypothetical protein N4G38_06960 [Cupriavidus gilardii]
MRALIVRLFMLITGKTEEQLGREWLAHYFVRRSRIRAYWHVLTR